MAVETTEVEIWDETYTIEIDTETGESEVVDVERVDVAEIQKLVKDHITSNSIEIEEIKHTECPHVEGVEQSVMARMDISKASTFAKNNVWAGRNLVPFYEAGWVPVSVARSTAWFVPADAVFNGE